MITYRQLTDVLDANGETHRMLVLQDGIKIVITQRGGRIFGPFVGDDSPSLTWVNPALAEAESFAAFIREGGWNMGGERVWIAPEIQYNIRDRADFWGSHHVPTALDPANYQVYSIHGEIILSTVMELQAYNLSRDTAHLGLKRHIQQGKNPLAALRAGAEMMKGVRFASYQHTVTLDDQGQTAPVSESWNLTQLNPGGVLLIPCTPATEASPYFGDPAPDALAPQGSAYRIAITGERQYKVGYKAAGVFGRMGYVNTLEDGQSYLLLRNFFNNPTATYAEEVPDQVGANGHSIHVYNGGAQFGRNGEMEASGQAIGGSTGRCQTTDVFTMSVFVGGAAQISRIAEALLGVQP
ncbi:MAG: hypothetical protein LCI00_10365 [Chloroflexi bacterium]|nr:hypothetical protein [Chloroflexota bacterium]MCC6894858.1 hypothetical protein [Anaerolineae bacterium]